MRFGGHETFHLRPGWLTKGMRQVASAAERPSAANFADPEVADDMGVGRNMARSIGFWLRTAGLVERPARGEPPRLSTLGQLLYRHDHYLQHPVSWWILHLELISREDALAAWRWFFADNGATDRFDRLACQEALSRYAERTAAKMPSPKTLERDVACLLGSYARPLPAEIADPEDATDCPLRALGLLVYHRDRGRYERRVQRRKVAPEVLALALCRMEGMSEEAAPPPDGESLAQVPFSSALSAAGSPARTLGLDLPGLDEALDEAQEALGAESLRRETLAGEQTILVRRRTASSWVEGYFHRTGGEAQ